MADKTDSVRVDGPNGERVQVLFYDDGSMRFRIYDCPMVIEEAFLTGNKQDHAIIAPPARDSGAEQIPARRL